MYIDRNVYSIHLYLHVIIVNYSLLAAVVCVCQDHLKSTSEVSRLSALLEVQGGSCVFASMWYLVMFWFGPWSHGLFSFLTHLFTGNQGAPQGLGREIQNTGPVAFWACSCPKQISRWLVGEVHCRWIDLKDSQSMNCRPKSPTKKRQSCKRHMLGFIAADWEFLGFCFAVPCRIAGSGLCRMSDFGKESSKSMAEVSRLSALLEASGLAIQPSWKFPVDSEDLNRFHTLNHSVRDLDRLVPKFFICW